MAVSAEWPPPPPQPDSTDCATPTVPCACSRCGGGALGGGRQVLVGVIIAAQLTWPELNFGIPWLSYSVDCVRCTPMR